MIPHSTTINRATQIAKSLAKENKSETFGAPHLMRALLNDDIGLTTELATNGVDIYYLRDWAEVRMDEHPKSTNIGDEIRSDANILKVFEVAEMVKLKLNTAETTPMVLFIAMVRPGVAFSKDQLQTLGVNEQTLLNIAMDGVELDKAYQSEDGGTGGSAVKTTNDYLSKYCVNRILIAKEGKIDPVVGRDEELRELTIILQRRQKPNALLVGEPGVGKTAIMDAYTTYCSENEKDDTQIFEVDLGALFAGASYKGEIEDRLKGIIREIKQHDSVVLFIDEIHTLMDPNSGAGGAMNIIKPELARGEITVVGATTLSEYREFIEPDDAIVRRFESLKVEEPTDEKALLMLEAVVPIYAQHHEVEVSTSGMEEAISLTRRYLKERKLPDAAIDLIDRTMASIKVAKLKGPEIIEEIKQRLEAEEKITIPQALVLVKEKLSPIVWMGFDERMDEVKEENTDDALNAFLEDLKTRIEKKGDEVKDEDIASIVAMRTGIPLGKIQASEKEKLLSLEDNMIKRVIGQDHAVKIISDSILESRSGLKRKGLPIGTFFFLGPTGTGKTELAKALAESVFNDKNALIRFDMSEFKEEHSAALLYGAPPGYIGYKEGGLLVNKIRQKPYAVVLFDEIEKAHASVFDIFLQILDEGKLHDKLGKEGDFSNAIVLFTSNIGSSFIVEQFGQNIIPESDKLMEIMAAHFRPEFLGRLTEIIPFSPITKNNIVAIFKLQMKELLENLGNQEMNLNLTDEATEALAFEGFNPQYGARPLRGVIRRRLTKPLSKLIVSGVLKGGQTINVGWDKEKNEITSEIEGSPITVENT